MNKDEYIKTSEGKRLKELFCPISDKCERKKITLNNYRFDMQINDENLVKLKGEQVRFYENEPSDNQNIQGFKNSCPEVTLLSEDGLVDENFGGYAFSRYTVLHEDNYATTDESYKHYSDCLEYKIYEYGKENDNAVSRAYVNPDRINEIKSVVNDGYDLSKLIRLSEELNICLGGKCYLSMAMLLRAILDHVPPIFECKSFTEIANNYSGTKSFKDAMKHLDNTSRKISDYYLHAQIRKSESLPNLTQIDFSNDLDFLLAEIVRIIKK